MQESLGKLFWRFYSLRMIILIFGFYFLLGIVNGKGLHVFSCRLGYVFLLAFWKTFSNNICILSFRAFHILTPKLVYCSFVSLGNLGFPKLLLMPIRNLFFWFFIDSKNRNFRFLRAVFYLWYFWGGMLWLWSNFSLLVVEMLQTFYFCTSQHEPKLFPAKTSSHNAHTLHTLFY